MFLSDAWMPDDRPKGLRMGVAESSERGERMDVQAQVGQVTMRLAVLTVSPRTENFLSAICP